MKSEHTEAFERDLEELIITAFSRGATVEGNWEIQIPVTDAPNWSVTITKHSLDEQSGYEPNLLDE
ncbi:hypothetical protein ATJ93_4469 [Halopiger aswanensis]|uniref:Amphi-Trp domain-containing protein n=1 Tax=Halopiger aswanensis TaxID=148449 RepID=A0A3R7HFS0_9EURY|nr:hypothetical protein ATJ93_4469 [Halopiger aswanensis]